MTVILHALLLEIPEELESERLTLVAAQPGQGAAVNEAVVESHAELKRWMPWAQKVPSVDESEGFCREGRAKWLARESLDFSFFRARTHAHRKGGLHSIDLSIPSSRSHGATELRGQGYARQRRRVGALAREHSDAERIESSPPPEKKQGHRLVAEKTARLEGIRGSAAAT